MVEWVREAETPREYIRMGSDGIMRVIYKPGSEMGLEEAKEAIAICLKVGPGHPVPVMVDIRQLKSQTREARFYLSGPEGAKNHRALALITPNPVSRMIGNVFIRFSSSTTPTRLCGSEEEALSWLRQFL